MLGTGQEETHAPQQGDRDRTLPDGRFVMRARSVDRDHDVGGLDHQADAAVHLDAELVDRLVGDRGRQDISSDVDVNMRSGRAFLDFDYDAPDVVACTDAHGETLLKLALATDKRMEIGRLSLSSVPRFRQ